MQAPSGPSAGGGSNLPPVSKAAKKRRNRRRIRGHTDLIESDEVFRRLIASTMTQKIAKEPTKYKKSGKEPMKSKRVVKDLPVTDTMKSKMVVKDLPVTGTMKKLKVEAIMRRRNKKGHNLQEKNQQEEWGLGNIKAEEVPDVVFPDVVFLLRSRVDSGIHVYALDTREFLTLKLLFTFSPPDPLGQMSFVGLGPTLYAVGGGYDPDSGEYPKTFLICNLKNWRERDDFQREKRDVAFKGAKPFPIVVAVNGMIYALAGCTLHGPPIGVDNNLDPVFEFFDPDKDYWQALPPPPFSALYSELGGPHFHANTVIGNTIYVAMWVGLGRSDIYSFHVVDRKWSHITIQDPSCDVIQRNLVKCRWEGHVEVAGNKLFHYRSGAKTGLLRLYACDLGATREDPPEKEEEEEKVLGESQHCEGGDDDGLHIVRELDSLISWDEFASTHIASYDSDDDWPIYCDTRCVYLPLRGLTVVAGLVHDDDNAGFVTHLGGKVYCFVYFYTLPNAQDAEDGRIGVCTFEAVEQQVGTRFLEVKILHSARHPISRDLDFYEDWCKIQGATKLVKAKPTLPTNFEENTWATLKYAISAIFLKQPDPCELEKLYQAVNDLCLHKMGGILYQRIQKECEAHTSVALQSLVGQSEDLGVFLSLVEKCWQDFCDQMLVIRRIASYLDRTYVRQTPNVRSLWGMGLQLFRKYLALAAEVEHKTVFGLLKMIENERLGEAVDRTLLNHLLKMFTALGIYSESFEKPFLKRTSGFYAAEGVKYMQQSDVPDYLKHVEIRLHEEHERCLLYLDASTRKPLVATAEKKLLGHHVSAILDKGFMMLMDGNRIEDLQRMYLLFLRINALESLRQALSSYIWRTGQGIVMDEEKDKHMVFCLLEFKASLDTIWEESFSRNEAFCNTINNAFEHLINLRQNRPAELIAKFLGEELRAGNKGTSEEELEGTLDKVLVLFRFIQGKDVFEAFYKKDLAKRLMLGKSASIDAEKSMISKLKTECGSQFTNKLEGMFKDIELSKEINESFKQSSLAKTKLPSGIEMSVHVLTMGYWLASPSMDVRFPQELNVYQDIFREFYMSKYSGRRLMWQNSFGHCVLKAEFPKGQKELAVSLFQTVVLMLFNDAQKLSFQDVKDSTGIKEKELRRTVQSLACGKIRVLQKFPKGREVEDDDSFVFNDGFTASLYSIKVNAIEMKETVEENTSTTERVFQDRQYQVDSAIVRIMRTRKVLSHTLLITELFQQLKFPIKLADLKKRVESLIDREYLERDKSNPQIYNYLD